MAIEIERKFLVRGSEWRAHATKSERLVQAYLNKGGGFTTRVRIVDGCRATLAIKSSRAGAKRLEFEYDIPVEDAGQLLHLGEGMLIEKVRHFVPWGELIWEIDVFEGANSGLCVAEIELSHEQQEFARPEWIGPEVTQDERFYNSRLSAVPYATWEVQFQDVADA